MLTNINSQISIQTLYLWKQVINNKIRNDVEVAHPDSGSSSTWFLVELEFGNVGFFWGEGEPEYREKKTSQSKGENRQQTQPTYGVDAGIWTRATLVEGECSHHCTALAPQASL